MTSMNFPSGIAKAAAILGLCFALGPALAGYFVGHSITNFKLGGRYVTVKGLSEREANSDLAIWKIRFKATSNDLTKTNETITEDKNKIINFLKNNGISENEIDFPAPRVIDLYAREYGPEKLPPNRYIVEALIRVKSNKVETIEMASKKASELIQAGVAIDENPVGANPAYVFSKLNDIRPQMLAEATKSARVLAEQFATDSGSKVGPIKQANQGTFTINSIDQGDEGDFQGAYRTPRKIVRVVSTIDYFLVD